GQVATLERERAGPGIVMQLGDRLRMVLGHFLDLHPALGAEDEDRLSRIPVQGQSQVELARDLLRRLAPDLSDGVALDRHAKNLARHALGVHRRPGQLDAARLAAAPDRDLRLDRDRPEGARGQSRLVGGAGQAAVRYRDAGGLETLLDLVLEEFHNGIFPWRRRGRSTCLSFSRCSERISVGRVSCGSMTSSRKPRSAATYGLANFSL